MSKVRAYLDHNASSPLRPAARAAMIAALDHAGNPSSVHAEGRAARALLSDARRQVAELVGADPRGVIFTASATEAANLVLSSGLYACGRSPPDRLLASATEHACVLGGHRFARCETVAVDENGVIDMAALDAALAAQSGPAMLALQTANNETGVLQPVRAAADLMHVHGGFLICDAVQAAGRIQVRLADLGADALILSSHKLGGPKGAGAVILADSDAHFDAPLLRGGGQERGCRAGTEDVAAIAGFGAACEEIARELTAETERARALRDRLERELRRVAPGAQVIGAGAPRLPNTSCFAAPPRAAATLLMALDLAGVAVSSGSACSSGKVGRSHVLDAMGVRPHITESVIRVSFGWNSLDADVDALLRALAEVLARAPAPDRAA